MTLEAFDCTYMEPATFREMLARTFNLRLTIGELSAIMRFFDPDLTGKVPCQDFIIHFLKTGFSERRKVLKKSLDKSRIAEKERIKEEEDKLAAQWAKIELNTDTPYEKEDLDSATAKLAQSARFFDPNTTDLKAFDGNYLSAAIFKEMLKRVFGIKVTVSELAALVDMFDTDKSKRIDCSKFMIKFSSLVFQERDRIHKMQLEKKKEALEREKNEFYARIKKGEDLIPRADIDFDFEKSDFESAMEKIRIEAAKYDRNHSSAPSLNGFQGANLPIYQFKSQLKKTFNITLTPQELGALVKYFDTSATGSVDSVEFLLHFTKINRLERSKIHLSHIEAERNLISLKKSEEDKKIERKKIEDSTKLVFIKADEESLLKKLKLAIQIFLKNTASFIEALQGFKGPALAPVAFKELFYRVFGIKLTYPELGVLLNLYDDNSLGSIDGGQFLNSFFKVSRLEEAIAQGNLLRTITLNDLRFSDNNVNAGQKTDSLKISLESYNQNKSKKSSTKLSQNEFDILKRFRMKSTDRLSDDSLNIHAKKTVTLHNINIKEAPLKQRKNKKNKINIDFILPQLLINQEFRVQTV